MFLFCLVFAMFCVRLFICASWSPAGKGLTSWLSFVVSSVSLSLSHWYPGSGVVLDCMDSWSLQPYLLLICTTVKQLYLFICKHISFQAKFCMLIVISLKNIEKIIFITKCSYVDFKMGSKVIKCNNRSIFTNCVSFFLWSNNKMLFKL